MASEYIQFENGFFSPDVGILANHGHKFQEVSDFGRVDPILIDWDNHMYYGHSDRRYGLALGY
jgi:gamma-glutamyltranspeptidase